MIIESFLQDLRIGMRVLIKEKTFCALAVFVLAVGIGAVTTQYAVVNGVLLRGFKFRDAERLVDVQLADPANFQPNNFNSRLTTADFADVRDQQKSFSEFVGYLNGSTVNVTWQGQPDRLTGGYITWDFFRALGVAPVLGRDFLKEEDQAGVDKAVILSDALWHRKFNADRDVIGKSIRVNGRAGTIVGIMPPKFQFPANEDLWIPVNAEFPVRPRNDRGVNFISVIARLKPGVSAQQAEADLSAIAKGFAEQFPDTNKQFTKGYVRPLIAAFTGGNLNGLLYTMLGLCVGVLLIACINVMNMQFARAALRSKELAVRSSLGATRIRLVRQMLTESLLIAALGATLGIGIAFWTTDYLNLYVHSGDQNTRIPSWMTFDLDVMVLSVVVGAAIFSALVSGFVPAWMSSRASAIDALKEGGRGNTSRAVNAITRGLVVFQILITCALLVSSVVMVRSIIKQQTLDYGYDTQGILGARMGLMEGDYPDSARRQLFYERLLRELRASPQFEAVALTYRFRMVFSGNGPIEIEGKSYKQDSDRTTSEFENVTAGYHEVLGQKVIEGRYLADEDSDQKLPVAVVNASFAKKHFNGQALGRRFRTINQNGTQPGPWRQVIGVVTDVRMAGPFNNNTDGTGFYVPLFSTAFGPAADTPQAQQFGTAVIRPRGGQRPEALAAALQAIVSKVDPNLPLYFVGTPKVAMDSFLAQLRLTAVMFTTFGVIAIVLASVGLYGVMSFSVNQRNQEFGVRMALGADAARILRMVLGQGAWQLGLGLGLGVLATAGVAWGFSGPLTNFLFQTNPLDPLPYLGVIALVSLVSLAAILIPARRATRVDPMVALRAQ
ncbi:MAG: ABC transporter permease [Lacunisphaera sp.]|jgi:putative ABC transport system permease protein|nr:ABC transporter permease [Lacunisphaera sp.]